MHTNGSQSFVFLDMPLWALLERTEKTDFWKIQQNVHIDHCSQVSRLHRSSLLPAIIFSDPVASKWDQHLTCVNSILVPSGPLTCTDLPS